MSELDRLRQALEAWYELCNARAAADERGDNAAVSDYDGDEFYLLEDIALVAGGLVDGLGGGDV